MRYAIVTETYPPEVNGVALTIQAKEQGLRDRGHQVDVIRPRQPADDETASHELLTRSAPIPGYPGMRFGFPAHAALRKLWRERRPDAIYIATEGPLGWSALRTALRMEIPVATGVHTRFDAYMVDYGFGFLQPVALAWMRRFHNRSGATLVPTCELSDYLRGKGFEDVYHLPRAVNTQRFDPSRRCQALRDGWGVAPDGLAAIYLGRIAAEKNLPLAVKAFRELQKQRPDAKFVWVGEGPEMAGIREANPDFVFCGLRRDEDLAAHFASADMFVFPSHSETFGNVTLESMASGVATIAFRYGAAREHIRHGVSGVAIEGEDEDAFVRAVVEVGCDDALRKSLGEQGRIAVRKLRPAQVSVDFDEILQRIARARDERHAQAAAA